MLSIVTSKVSETDMRLQQCELDKSSCYLPNTILRCHTPGKTYWSAVHGQWRILPSTTVHGKKLEDNIPCLPLNISLFSTKSLLCVSIDIVFLALAKLKYLHETRTVNFVPHLFHSWVALGRSCFMASTEVIITVTNNSYWHVSIVLRKT